MTKIDRRENILKRRQERLAAKYDTILERCPHEGCTALNSPNATHCHKCGRRLYGLDSSQKRGLNEK